MTTEEELEIRQRLDGSGVTVAAVAEWLQAARDASVAAQAEVGRKCPRCAGPMVVGKDKCFYAGTPERILFKCQSCNRFAPIYPVRDSDIIL